MGKQNKDIHDQQRFHTSSSRSRIVDEGKTKARLWFSSGERERAPFELCRRNELCVALRLVNSDTSTINFLKAKTYGRIGCCVFRFGTCRLLSAFVSYLLVA